MRVNQLYIDWTFNEVTGRYEALIPKDLSDSDIKNASVYKSAVPLKHPLPVRIIYLTTVFILHNGHDYRLEKTARMITTSSPQVADTPILIEWGEVVNFRCDSGHETSDDSARFCPQCGEPTHLK